MQTKCAKEPKIIMAAFILKASVLHGSGLCRLVASDPCSTPVQGFGFPSPPSNPERAQDPLFKEYTLNHNNNNNNHNNHTTTTTTTTNSNVIIIRRRRSPYNLRYIPELKGIGA